MKPGYKIIIAGLLVYGGFKVKVIMDVAPYKERASQFVTLLKQSKPFAVQEILSDALQKEISVERINQLIQEQNLTQSREIQWSAWQQVEGNYTLEGSLHLSSTQKQMDVMFKLFPYREKDIRISRLKIGGTTLECSTPEKAAFLE